MNGINQSIIARANELASLSARGENLAAACAVLSAEETQALEEAVWSPLHFYFVKRLRDIDLFMCNRSLWQRSFWR